jgi:polysaccharide export outer membrane protein
MRRETGRDPDAVPVMAWFRLLFALLLVPLAACALNGPQTVLESTLDHPYTLDSGDVVKVSVYGDDSISRSYRVDDSGDIAFPLVGQVAVRGMTTVAAAKAIAAALANGYMKSPNVTLEVDTYRPFYISGAVSSPGQFPYVPGMTVRSAISTAGGVVLGSGIHTEATLYRRVGDATVKSRVDLDFPILAGDTLVVD